MSIERLENYLENHHVEHTTIPHPRTFTAQRTAASVDIPGREVAKTVMIRIDGMMAMAVVPAPYKVDLNLIRNFTGAQNVELAEEDEFAAVFPDCEVGAMPPFGNLYGMKVFVDKHLTEDEEIAFNAGSLTELMKMSYKDYERVVRPMVTYISAPLHHTRHAA